MTQNNLGNALSNQASACNGEDQRRLLGEAIEVYRAALEVYTRESLPRQWADTQNNLGIVLADLHRYQEALSVFQELAQIEEEQNPINAEKLSEIESNCCWFAALAGQYSEALVAGEKAVSLLNDDNASPARMNIAHAYLFNEQFEKAKEIYVRYFGQDFEDGRKWNDELRGDFKILREAGQDQPDMKKIEALLEESETNAPDNTPPTIDL